MSSPSPPRRGIEAELIGDVTVVTFLDRRILDSDSHAAVGEALFRQVDELGRRKVLLNLGNVEYWNTTLLGKIITLFRKVKAVQGKMVLCNVAPDLVDVFAITKLDKILAVVVDPGLVDVNDVIREVFGNPLQPAVCSPEWRTETAVLLARQMHESRDYSAMPILADALQDAGCDSADVLNHCRDPKQVHVRGCWVIDLLLAGDAATPSAVQ